MQNERKFEAQTISIHAPPRGATRLRRRSQASPCRISIHAPPRGATRISAESVGSLHPISIHAPPRGATRKNARVLSSTTFQFTPLREGRLLSMYNRCSGRYISIHAPPRGATERSRRESGRRSYFNSRPSARGDDCRRDGIHRTGHFNSRPSARGDAWSKGKNG